MRTRGHVICDLPRYDGFVRGKRLVSKTGYYLIFYTRTVVLPVWGAFIAVYVLSAPPCHKKPAFIYELCTCINSYYNSQLPIPWGIDRGVGEGDLVELVRRLTSPSYGEQLILIDYS